MIYEFPTEFPMDAAKEAFRIVKGGTTKAEAGLLCRCGITLEAYGLSFVAKDAQKFGAVGVEIEADEAAVAGALDALIGQHESPEKFSAFNPAMILAIWQAIQTIIAIIKKK